MMSLNLTASSRSLNIRSPSWRRKSKRKIKLSQLSILTTECQSRKLTWLKSSWMLKRRNSRRHRKQLKRRNRRLWSWRISSRIQLLSMNSPRKSTRRLSMSVTFWELNWSVETMSLLFCTRRSKFFRLHLPRENYSIKNVLRISSCLSSVSEISSASFALSKPKPLRSEILEKSVWDFNPSLWLRSCKSRRFQKSWRTLSTITDGANLKALTLTPGNCCKRSKLFRRGWSRRPRR